MAAVKSRHPHYHEPKGESADQSSGLLGRPDGAGKSNKGKRPLGICPFVPVDRRPRTSAASPSRAPFSLPVANGASRGASGSPGHHGRARVGATDCDANHGATSFMHVPPAPLPTTIQTPDPVSTFFPTFSARARFVTRRAPSETVDTTDGPPQCTKEPSKAALLPLCGVGIVISECERVLGGGGSSPPA